MWILLVAAGSCYLAKCWQNALSSVESGILHEKDKTPEAQEFDDSREQEGYSDDTQIDGENKMRYQEDGSNSVTSNTGIRRTDEVLYDSNEKLLKFPKGDVDLRTSGTISYRPELDHSFKVELEGMHIVEHVDSGDASSSVFPFGKRASDFYKHGLQDDTKRMKDCGGDKDAVEELSINTGSSFVNSSQYLLGLSSFWFVPPSGQLKVANTKVKTSSRPSKGKAALKKSRYIRASPKPVSSLESCLRAQMHRDRFNDSGRQVSQSLFFSPLRQEVADSGLSAEMGRYPCAQNAPEAQLQTTSSHLMVEGSPTCSSSSNSTEENPETTIYNLAKECVNQAFTENMKIKSTCERKNLKKRKTWQPTRNDTGVTPYLEALLFSFGVGVGVMHMLNSNKIKVEKLQKSLREAEEVVETLQHALSMAKSTTVPSFENQQRWISEANVPVSNQKLRLLVETLSEGISGEDQDSIKSGLTFELSRHGDDMADLEEEFEAELELMRHNMTAPSSSYHADKLSSMSDVDTTDIGEVVNGELSSSGLPMAFGDDDDKVFSRQADVEGKYCAVSPRELDRRLRIVLQTRQEERISELELELQDAENNLQLKENELQLWRERVKMLTKLSLVSASGDDYILDGNDINRISMEMSPTEDDEICSEFLKTFGMTDRQRPFQNVEKSGLHISDAKICGNLGSTDGMIRRVDDMTCRENNQYGDVENDIGTSSPQWGLPGNSGADPLFCNSAKEMQLNKADPPLESKVGGHQVQMLLNTVHSSGSGKKFSEEVVNSGRGEGLSSASSALTETYTVTANDVRSGDSSKSRSLLPVNCSTWESASHAGANTPETSKRVLLGAPKHGSTRVNTSVLEKVKYWESLSNHKASCIYETKPSSCASEREECYNQQTESSCSEGESSWDDSSVSDHEGHLDDLINKCLVEKTKKGSDILKNVKTMLAALENSDQSGTIVGEGSAVGDGMP